ncbi:FtsX-like permease family protein [Paenibacillus puldeungensis]|uniref:FtsX-like permease family protein n=1 Tax=Paenibacillus puldeungensis TaxID=696536 RepID=A0ABW3S491_9BACL
MNFRQFAFNNVLRNKRIYAAYFLSSSFSVMIFFVCAMFLFHPDLREKLVYHSALYVLETAEAIMYVFSVFFVIYSVGSFLRSRKKEFGILLLHGMTEKQLRRLVFLENMLIGAGAIVCGMAGGILTAKLFLMFGSNLLGIPPLSFHITWSSLLLTIFSFTLLFLLISLLTTVLLGPHRLIDLLQTGIRPALQTKASVPLSLLAAALLGLSYVLAVTTSASTLMIRMLPVTGMTILGTYLFFSQFSVFLIEAVKKRLRFYWKKTNLVTISNLAYRMKDNAVMLFLVTIISTVTFCAMGAFASINRMADEFEHDYPVDIGYVSKAGNKLETEYIKLIDNELTTRGIRYRTEKLPVYLVGIASSTEASSPDRLPVIAYSDYRRLMTTAGFLVHEKELKNNEALVLISSQREKLLLKHRKLVGYVLKDQGLRIREIGLTEHVAIPEWLTEQIGNDRDGSYSGLVVSDEFVQRIKSPLEVDRLTAFFVDHLQRTEGLASSLAEKGEVRYKEGKSYSMTVSGTLYKVQRTTYGALLFFALLVGTVFFIAAGSFLYFRLYSDLEYDRRQYAAMAKLGLTDKELAAIVTRQIGLLFFVPIVLAIIHSLFAFIAMQSFFNFSVVWETGLILCTFLLVQVVYFFFIRARYLRNVRKTMRST